MSKADIKNNLFLWLEAYKPRIISNKNNFIIYRFLDDDLTYKYKTVYYIKQQISHKDIDLFSVK